MKFKIDEYEILINLSKEPVKIAGEYLANKIFIGNYLFEFKGIIDSIIINNPIEDMCTLVKNTYAHNCIFIWNQEFSIEDGVITFRSKNE